MSGKNLTWELVHDEQIVKDRWMDMKAATYRLPDGREVGPFYHYSRKDFVVIVAVDENGDFVCVRQFRQGIREVTTEFPAGGIEQSDGLEYGNKAAAENALDCARRELMEETGFVSDQWTHLITIPANATISDNYAYVFLAENCRKAGSQHLDETECLNMELRTAEEIEEMIRTGNFQQSVHVMAWLLAKEHKQRR